MTASFLSDEIRALFDGRPAPARPEGYDDLRQAAAFFLLVDRDETHAFLVKKKETPGYTWSGQVGMVGGMIEKGEDDLEAAYREFEEEVRLPRGSLEYFGDLGYFESSIANALLHVYVAKWNGEGEPVPDPSEIDYLIEIPFSVLREIHEKEGYAGMTPDPEGRGPFYPIRLGGAGDPRRTPSRGSEARRREADLDEPLPEAGPQVPSRKGRRKEGLAARGSGPQQEDGGERRLVVWGVTARTAHSLLELLRGE